MQSIGSAMGICPIHKIDLMAVGFGDENLTPTCVKCKAAAEPKSGRPQTAQDPGAEFFGAQPDRKPIQASKQPVLVSSNITLSEIVERAKNEINSLPMPKDIKEFKRIQKVLKTLEALVEKSNG